MIKLISCIFMAVLLVADGFTVHGPSAPLVAPMGSSVVLPCYIGEVSLMEDLEVEWRRADTETLVHLYLDGESRPEAQQQDYHDRAHFFAEEIQHGKFSLRLDNLTAQDEGKYRCKVFIQHDSGEIVAEIKVGNGFSSWHLAVLLFCISAGSGAVLLLCCLIYYRLKNTVTRSTVWNLQFSLVFFPNICMFFAFILWGFTEGSLHETITCSSLYILRPFMLIWVLPHLKYLQGNLKPWTSFFTATKEFAVFTVVVYSVFFSYGWSKRAHDTVIGPLVLSGINFGGVVLTCLSLFTGDFLKLHSREQQKGRIQSLGFKLISFHFILSILALSEFTQLTFSFGNASLGVILFFTVVFGYMAWLVCMPCFLLLTDKCLCRTWMAVLWIITIPVLDIILFICIHLAVLEREKDRLEWICVILFLQVLKMKLFFVQAKNKLQNQRRRQTEMSQQGSNTWSLCSEIMYMFGAVGVVLLSSVSLTAELILKALNGERAIEDLRVIVFPAESAFVFYWLLLRMHAYLCQASFADVTHPITVT